MAKSRRIGRRLSTKMRKHITSEVSTEVLVFLITLRHPDLDEDIYVSSDPTEVLGYEADNVIYGTTSRGVQYLYAGFEAHLPNDEDGAAPQVEISLPNASRELIEAIERMGSDVVSVDLELVLSETPDIVEIQCKNMEMSNISYDANTVSGTISRDLLFQEPYPCRSFIPQHYPFLFATGGAS